MSNATTSAVPPRAKASVGPAYIWGLILFSAFAVIAYFWFHASGTEQSYDEKRGTARVTKLQTLRQEDQKSLSSYGWVNKEKGVAHIPIDRAMELVSSELKDSKVAPSTVKVENPYPAGLAPQPAPAPEATK